MEEVEEEIEVVYLSLHTSPFGEGNGETNKEWFALSVKSLREVGEYKGKVKVITNKGKAHREIAEEWGVEVVEVNKVKLPLPIDQFLHLHYQLQIAYWKSILPSLSSSPYLLFLSPTVIISHPLSSFLSHSLSLSPHCSSIFMIHQLNPLPPPPHHHLGDSNDGGIEGRIERAGRGMIGARAEVFFIDKDDVGALFEGWQREITENGLLHLSPSSSSLSSSSLSSSSLSSADSSSLSSLFSSRLSFIPSSLLSSYNNINNEEEDGEGWEKDWIEGRKEGREGWWVRDEKRGKKEQEVCIYPPSFLSFLPSLPFPSSSSSSPSSPVYFISFTATSLMYSPSPWISEEYKESLTALLSSLNLLPPANISSFIDTLFFPFPSHALSLAEPFNLYG